MRPDVRIVLAGDSSVGKSTLLTSLIKESYVEDVQRRIPEITLPADVCPEGVSCKVVDTCATSEHRLHLESELRRASVICLVYSIALPSSFDRLPTYWLPLIRSLGINVPIILVGNQIDLRSGSAPHSALEAELAPVMSEFKEVETCVECSAKLPLNVSEVFYFAQKAVLYPTAPLYDSRSHALKPACVAALRRIFRLCDADKDGVLDDRELNDFQRKCFDAPLQSSELEGIKELVRSAPLSGGGGGGGTGGWGYDDLSAAGSATASDAGTEPLRRSHPHLRGGALTLSGFLYLHTLFIQRGRLETTWTVLRVFGYGSDLQLEASFVSPPFPVPQDCSVELSPHGYQFLTDVFEAHDKDRDGALSPRELSALFSTVPETSRAPAGAHPWGADFPHATTVTDEAGRVTLQGWLAQWSMTTLLSPPTTLAMLAYLGYPSFTPSSSLSSGSGGSGSSSSSSSTPQAPRAPSTLSALQLTRPRRERARKTRKGAPGNRSVLLAYVVGAAGSGKSAILQHLVGEPFEEGYRPTPGPRAVVASVEWGGAEKYLVLQEFGSRFESEALRSSATVSKADVLIYVYDSSDTNSFSYISNLRQQYPHLSSCASLFVGTKADLDLAQQRHEVQPDAYCAKLGLNIPGVGPGPINISTRNDEMADLAGIVCRVALDPRGAVPGGGEKALWSLSGGKGWREGWVRWALLGATLGGAGWWVKRAMGAGTAVQGRWRVGMPSWMAGWAAGKKEL